MLSSPNYQKFCSEIGQSETFLKFSALFRVQVKYTIFRTRIELKPIIPHNFKRCSIIWKAGVCTTPEKCFLFIALKEEAQFHNLEAPGTKSFDILSI